MDLVRNNKSVNDRMAEKNRGEISLRLGEAFATESMFDEAMKMMRRTKKGKKSDLSDQDIKSALFGSTPQRSSSLCEEYFKEGEKFNAERTKSALKVIVDPLNVGRRKGVWT